MSDESWISSLPDELQSNPTLAKFEDPSQLAKSYIELEAFRGQSLRIPGEDASAADQQQFYDTVMQRVPGLVRKPVEDDQESSDNFWKSMGKPEKIDEYPEIEGMTPEQTEALRAAALDSNLTKAQFKKLAETMAGKATTERENIEFERKSEAEALFHKWGVAKDQKLQAIRHMASQLGMDESLMADINAEVPNAKVLEFMDTIVQKIGTEGSQMQQQIGDQGTNVMTPQEAELKISEIMNNNDHAFWNPADPGHEAAKRKVIELQTFATPGASTTMASQRVGHGSLAASTKDTIF